MLGASDHAAVSAQSSRALGSWLQSQSNACLDSSPCGLPVLQQRDKTKSAAASKPSVEEDFEWTSFASDPCTLTPNPVTARATDKFAHPCDDQSCRKVSRFDASIDFGITRGGFVILVYRIPLLYAERRRLAELVPMHFFEGLSLSKAAAWADRA